VRRRRSSRDAIFFGAALFAVASLALQATVSSAATNVSHLAGFIAGSVITAVWCTRPAVRRAGTAVAVAFLVIAGSVSAARTVDVRRSDLAVRAETPVGFPPVMITPGFGSLWVTGGREGDPKRDEIVRLDETSGRVSARIREQGVGGLPVVTKDHVWAAAKGRVVAIDPSSNRIVSRIRLSDGAWPWSLAATEDALWAAVTEPGEVIRIDLRTREQTHIAVGPRAFVVAAHGSNVWATTYGGQTVSRLDPRTGMVLEQRRFPNGVYHAVFLAGSVWVGAQPFIYRLHPESLEVIAKIDVGRETWTLAPGGRGTLLVPQRYLRSIVQVDPKTNAVERRVVVGLRQPISVAAVGDDLWIADPFGRSILRTSAA
jgi:streptogramin lyase